MELPSAHAERFGGPLPPDRDTDDASGCGAAPTFGQRDLAAASALLLGVLALPFGLARRGRARSRGMSLTSLAIASLYLSATVSQTGCGQGEPSARGPVGPAVFYYHADQIGSTALITDAAGRVVERLRYKPYGEVQRPVSRDFEATHTFAAYEQDAETGNHFARARYYSPVLGRFLAADPAIGDAADPLQLNRYAYGRDNPLSITDPQGMFIFFALGPTQTRGLARGPLPQVHVQQRHRARLGGALLGGGRRLRLQARAAAHPPVHPAGGCLRPGLLRRCTAAEDTASRAREVGAVGALGKPFELDDLLRLVERYALPSAEHRLH